MNDTLWGVGAAEVTPDLADEQRVCGLVIPALTERVDRRRQGGQLVAEFVDWEERHRRIDRDRIGLATEGANRGPRGPDPHIAAHHLAQVPGRAGVVAHRV